MIDIRNLSKSFGKVQAVRDVTFSAPDGAVTGLLGANGAGKTTTINLFLDVVQPSSGVARVNGLDVATHAAETKAHLAYIPETVMLYRTLTGVENLEYFSALAGHGEYGRDQLLDFLARVGLQREAADRRVGAYSKGMRQKVGIAIALAKRAGALLLDEPTSGLDPKASNEFSVLLQHLSGEGVAVLMATHDLFRAKESGTRVGIMKHGCLVQTISTDDIGHADLERLYLEHMHD
jgi:ABC-2 type transport system ATP-binding protein